MCASFHLILIASKHLSAVEIAIQEEVAEQHPSS